MSPMPSPFLLAILSWDDLFIGPFSSQLTLLVTLAALGFAILIAKNRWGIASRLALIPVSFIPILMGVGNAAWKLSGSLHRGGHPAAYATRDILEHAREYLSFIPGPALQTLILLIVTAWTLATVSTARPTAD